MCPASGKSKICFSSKKEADLFISYNGLAIEEEKGKAPIRSYYCPSCGCWHLTSRKEIFGSAAGLIRKTETHIKRLHNYIGKQKACKAHMEYEKSLRFLSEACEYNGGTNRKLELCNELEDCRRQCYSIDSYSRYIAA